ncbi:probable serine/threonine-protein kinase At1g54610 [Ananas comosus]|uniref:[RNA-polymerase]-subunit kinase n=1 Tax=Ananas comosus TaxID=4615 RepID=A0A6P5EKZ9_ANACO|nr:probable serine/threonine-protein kinase At1g54610 [Ananas comosus]
MGCILGKLNAAADDDCPFSLSALLFPPASTAGDPLRAPLPPPSAAELRRTPSAAAARDSAGWPLWLSAAAGDALRGWAPRRADSFQKLEKIGSGTYSNVYKAVDTATGRVVALKKVRVEPGAAAAAAEAAAAAAVMKMVNHSPPSLGIPRAQTDSDTSAVNDFIAYIFFSLNMLSFIVILSLISQVKCYMKQLLSGLEHCHNRGILHRDIKSSNLLLSKEGILKIADFGLATAYDPENMQPMTSQVVTLWYRPPELLLGATYYGVGVDLWSVGCILAELLTGEPIFPGRTEVEQLHKIFKLCGTPSEDYWTKLKLPQTTFKPYERCISEKFKDLPPSALALVDTLLLIDPDGRGTATAALNSEFFTTEPYACEPSSLPQYPPSKEMDIKLRRDKPRRKERANASVECGKTMKARPRNAGYRGAVTPEVDGNAKAIKDIPRLITSSSVTKMERFPPPHLDAAIGYNLDTSLDSTEDIFTSSIIEATKVKNRAVFGSIDHPAGMTLKAKTRALARARARPGLKISPSSVLIGAFRPYSIGQAMEVRRKTKVHNRHKV